MHHRAQSSAAIHQELMYILKRYIGDPRLQKISITAVQLSKKLDYANISITQLDTQFTPEETLAGCQKAAPRIRYHLAQQFKNGYKIPKLRFNYDTALLESIQLRQLLHPWSDIPPT